MCIRVAFSPSGWYLQPVSRSDTRRRWAGVLCLGAAILLVVWGQFFLPRDATPLLQVAFWTLCFLFTVAAILIALQDLRVLRDRTRAEKRALLEQTLREIEKESKLAQTQN